MKPDLPGSILLLFLIVLCITAAGCSESKASYDILVTRYDDGGHPAWSTMIGSQAQDLATVITETPDAGYAVSGTTGDSTTGMAYPRVVRLDPSGKILWDRTLDASNIYSVAITGAPYGGFVVAESINNFDAGKIVKIDAGGQPVWNRTMDISFKSVIPTGDGGYVLAGSRTLRIDANGTTIWDLPVPSTSVIPAAGGGFIAERSGTPYPEASILRTDENGTVLWTTPVGNRVSGKIPSLHEDTNGNIEALYTFWDPAKDKDLVMYMESEQVTLGKSGNITGRMTIAAVDPVARTTDGGYAFLAYPFPGSVAFTLPHTDSSLHLVRLTPRGAVVWDKALDLRPMASPVSVLQAGDGGFVTVVLVVS